MPPPPQPPPWRPPHSCRRYRTAATEAWAGRRRRGRGGAATAGPRRWRRGARRRRRTRRRRRRGPRRGRRRGRAWRPESKRRLRKQRSSRRPPRPAASSSLPRPCRETVAAPRPRLKYHSWSRRVACVRYGKRRKGGAPGESSRDPVLVRPCTTTTSSEPLVRRRETAVAGWQGQRQSRRAQLGLGCVAAFFVRPSQLDSWSCRCRRRLLDPVGSATCSILLRSRKWRHRWGELGNTRLMLMRGDKRSRSGTL